MVVRWLATAEADLKAIYDYHLSIAGHKTAVKIIDRIQDVAELLGTMPLVGPVERYLDDRPEGFRSIVVRRRHKIVYYIGNESEAINIVLIWDCRRNPFTLRGIINSGAKG